jgi:hypothetical protein
MSGPDELDPTDPGAEGEDLLAIFDDEPDWRPLAGLGYSALISLLWLMLVAGLVLGLFALGPAEIGNPHLPWLLQNATVLALALAAAAGLLMWLASWLARRLDMPRPPPLVAYPFIWLLNAEARLDAAISRSPGVRWRPPPGSEPGPGPGHDDTEP